MPQESYIDPTTVRLSRHFLLSDLMGCNSVYAKGYPNIFDGDKKKLREGKALCENVLEPLLEYSRLSIAYGYISPELSRLIVKYQDPDKPSYHRWDLGAACDVMLHERVDSQEAPAVSSFWIDENLPVSRVISYSESPFICVGSRYSEIHSGDHRRALYENRYIGERKPQYIAYSDNPATRKRQKDEALYFYAKAGDGWRGAGHPTYHGGGVRQFQHIRTGKYSVLSDFLYSEEAVTDGHRNAPTQRGMRKFQRAGEIYDALISAMHLRRLSIVRGYESPDWKDSLHNWSDGVYLVVVPPDGVNPNEVAEVARSLPGVHMVGAAKNRRVAIGARLRV